MSHIVLVHGAWHGAWAWSRVMPLLRAAGHQPYAVTLTGVGERAHLLSPHISLETHIADVAGLIEAEELQDVVLVVHSYAGMIGTAIADRMPHRLAHLAYVDACVPESGESWSSGHMPATRLARLEAAAQHPLNAIVPPDPKAYGLSGEEHAWVQRRQTPHPAETYTNALHFNAQRVCSVPRTFIDCNAPALATIDLMRMRVRDRHFWGGHWQTGGRVLELATGHDPMVSCPIALADLLLECMHPKSKAHTSRAPAA